MVVVGYGAARAAAAIAAHGSGAKVLILGKAPERYRGGTTRVSGNALFLPAHVEKAILYFNAMAGPRRDNISDEEVRTWAEEIYNNRDWLQRFNQLKHLTHIFPLERILDTGGE